MKGPSEATNINEIKWTTKSMYKELREIDGSELALPILVGMVLEPSATIIGGGGTDESK